MQTPNAVPAVTEPLDSRARLVESAKGTAVESGSAPLPAIVATRTTPFQIVLMVLAAIAFLYFARPADPRFIKVVCDRVPSLSSVSELLTS